MVVASAKAAAPARKKEDAALLKPAHVRAPSPGCAPRAAPAKPVPRLADARLSALALVTSPTALARAALGAVIALTALAASKGRFNAISRGLVAEECAQRTSREDGSDNACGEWDSPEPTVRSLERQLLNLCIKKLCRASWSCFLQERCCRLFVDRECDKCAELGPVQICNFGLVPCQTSSVIVPHAFANARFGAAVSPVYSMQFCRYLGTVTGAVASGVFGSGLAMYLWCNRIDQCCENGCVVILP